MAKVVQVVVELMCDGRWLWAAAGDEVMELLGEGTEATLTEALRAAAEWTNGRDND